MGFYYMNENSLMAGAERSGKHQYLIGNSALGADSVRGIIV